MTTSPSVTGGACSTLAAQLCVLLCVPLCVLTVGCGRSDQPATSSAAQGPPAARPAPTAGSALPVALPRFVDLVKEQGTTVVNVSALRSASGAGRVPPGHPLYEFFRRFGGPPDAGEVPSGSVGSGFIISPDGFILTNAHVIAGTDTLRVKLTNKREYSAKVIGADPYTDIALIKIDATGLPAVRTGDPAVMEPGEWVAAIGAPFGFDNSVTVGVVSAKGRILPQGSYVPFIQTDVAVNPGNSGGPLFNTRGEVIGINSQIYSQTGGYMGISFAIPIDIAMEISQQLKRDGKVTRGRIGVQLQELTYDIAESLDLKQTQGALVAAVERGGPAHRAGLRPLDVVLAVDGRAVVNTADLARIVGSATPGTSISADVWRGGSRRNIRIPVELLPQ